jgi:translation initiation factor IF-3
MASPPVVKFLDFGQYKYELTKREKEAKRKQRSVTFKEVRLSPKIGIGDFDTKVHRAIEFLEDGDRIKVTVRFRGRELTHPELGRNLIAKFADRVKDHGVPERTPLLEGKSMHITMASIHKPKGHDAPPARANEPARATEPAPEEPPVARPVAGAPEPAGTPEATNGAAEAANQIEATEPVPVATAARTTTRTTPTKAAAEPKATNDKTPAPEPVRTGE